MVALDWLSKSKPPEGTVISTFCQTAGRGQIGSRWESEPAKNISLSLVLYPEFLSAHRQFLLSQAVSLAVLDFAASYLPGDLKIKWPNDIYVFDKKIAGILIQNSLSGSSLTSSVVGIGVNVNQEAFVTNPPNPTSFKLETGNDFDLYELIATLCCCLEQRYLELSSGKIVPLQRAYTEQLYRFGEANFFQRPSGEIFSGTITGVAESGKLLVQTASGEEAFDLKEISFIKK